MLLGESGLSRLWERVVGYVNEYVETYDSLAVATRRKRGQVRPDNVTITVDEDGTIHGAAQYELPTASESTLGGVKVDGDTITVDGDGTIHGASTYEIASTEDAITGTDDEMLMTPLKVAQAIDARAGDAADVRLGIVTDELGNRRVAILVRRN